MSREPEILKSIIDDTEYNKTPQSRNEEILLSILNNTEYTKTPQSREEELLLELKEKIGHGITVEPLSVTENGTYTAPAGTAYNPVEVNITPPQLVKRVTGNPVEFSDGADAPVVKCVTQITGSQDLHGYDKPWVGGAGKNKLPLVLADIKTQNTTGTWSGNTYTYTTRIATLETYDGISVSAIHCKNTSTSGDSLLILDFTMPAGSYILSSGASETSGAIDTFVMKDGSVIARGNDQAPGPAFTLESDSLISFRVRINVVGEITFYPMIRLSTETDSDFTPYSNICPITAYTEGEIVERGKNILDPAYKSHGSTNVYFYQSDGFLIEAGKTYTLSCDTVIDSITVNLLDSTKIYGVSDSNKLTFTPSEDMTVYFRFRNGDGISTINDFQLELGSSVTAYEPYTSTTHTTTYPSAIYRGSEDVVNGEVTSEWIVRTISNITWNYSTGVATNRHYYVPIPNDNILLSCYPLVSWSTFQNSDCCACYYGGYLRIKDTQFDDATVSTAVNNFVTARGSEQIAYELATPTTSSVTPTNLPIRTLSGYNHIESSTGEMVVDYITDAYQNFVDTVNRAVPNTRKGGTTAMEVFMSLEQYEEHEPDPEDDPTEDMKGESR